MLDQIDQYHYRFRIGRHPWPRDGLGQAGLLLLFADLGISGKPDPSPHQVFPENLRMVAKVREKGEWFQPEQLAELSAAQPLR